MSWATIGSFDRSRLAPWNHSCGSTNATWYSMNSAPFGSASRVAFTYDPSPTNGRGAPTWRWPVSSVDKDRQQFGYSGSFTNLGSATDATTTESAVSDFMFCVVRLMRTFPSNVEVTASHRGCPGLDSTAMPRLRSSSALSIFAAPELPLCSLLI